MGALAHRRTAGNLSKKSADRGIDGNIYFGQTSRAIVSVKAGDSVGVAMIRDRALRLPARRDDAFRRAPREEDREAQGSLDL